MSILYPDLPRTTFPNDVDTITSYTDITSASDLSLVNMIQNYMLQGNFEAAQALLAQNPVLSTKIITADKMNKNRDIIVALERYLKGDYQDYIETIQVTWKEAADRFSWQGEYQYNKIYQEDNILGYDGKLYVCIKTTPSTGLVPTNTTYYRLLTIKGNRGESGTGLSFVGEYDSTQEYKTNDMVLYENNLYASLLDSNTGNNPATNTTYWELALEPVPPATYIIAEEQPTTLSAGELWFKLGKVVD